MKRLGKRPIVPNKEKVKQILEATGGTLTASARAYGVCFITFRKWLDEDPELAEFSELMRCGIVDRAEGVANESLQSPDEKVRADMAKFILRTKGDWADKQDITQTNVNIDAGTIDFSKLSLDEKRLLKDLIDKARSGESE